MGNPCRYFARFDESNITKEDEKGITWENHPHCPVCGLPNEWIKLSECASFWGCKECDGVNKDNLFDIFPSSVFLND